MKCGFTDAEIEHCKKYKYNGTDDSILAKLFLRSYWNWLIEFVPMNIAPNLITFIGFLFELVSFITTMIFSHSLSKPLPGWACIWNGISLFIYQTLDNLDGRQARRTNTSSPLGQFFDHGCDAITGVLEIVKACGSLNMGVGAPTFFFVILIAFGFFLTTWEEFAVDAFYLGPINGPDEGLLFLSILQIILGIVPSLQGIGNSVFAYLIIFGSFIGTVVPIVIHVFKESKNDSARAKKSLISVIPSLVSFILFLALSFKESKLWDNLYFTMSAGFIQQYLAQKAIVCHIVHRKAYHVMDVAVIGLWILAVVALVLSNLANTYNFWVLYCGIIISTIIIFDLIVINGLCKGLNIKAFVIKPQEEVDDLRIEPVEDVLINDPEDRKLGEDSVLFGDSNNVQQEEMEDV